MITDPVHDADKHGDAADKLNITIYKYEQNARLEFMRCAIQGSALAICTWADDPADRASTFADLTEQGFSMGNKAATHAELVQLLIDVAGGSIDTKARADARVILDKMADTYVRFNVDAERGCES